ncbi:hypothetical protein ACQEVC_24935 [Plantactinospora sp. CA-294935]|uniref:hypothetical protein n=1 Tax=Plantactinospora sp. CA-294935 TaxID=3240012 RepID=UPI003D8EFD5B
MFALTAILNGVLGTLSTGGFDDPDSDLAQASKLLEGEFGAGIPNILLVVTAPNGDIE